MTESRALHAPAAERNKAPILDVLAAHLPPRGRVLEIASGTGQHVVHFAAALPGLVWLPSDPDASQRASIAAHAAAAGLDNVAEPLELDVLSRWPDIRVDAVVVANLLHVAPPQALPALCAGAAGVLAAGGVLHVYGPFNRDGRYTSEGNQRFDRALREQNPVWGIRDLETLLAAAADCGLRERQVIDMPANNLSVVLIKAA
jgi:SAM-dependent methyltransferase